MNYGNKKLKLPSNPNLPDTEKQEKNIIQDELKDIVKEQVLKSIKGDIAMTKFKASHLWDYRWRVDVWCEHESNAELSLFKSMRIDYSYFIRTDEAGKIISSDPSLGEKCNV
jgi:hypothetical protein